MPEKDTYRRFEIHSSCHNSSKPRTYGYVLCCWPTPVSKYCCAGREWMGVDKGWLSLPTHRWEQPAHLSAWSGTAGSWERPPHCRFFSAVESGRVRRHRTDPFAHTTGSRHWAAGVLKLTWHTYRDQLCALRAVPCLAKSGEEALTFTSIYLFIFLLNIMIDTYSTFQIFIGSL